MTGANRSGELTAEEWGWPRRSIAASAAIRPRDDPGRRRADSLAVTEFFKESASLFRSAGGGPI
jgi:hypothetical protein